MMEKEAEEEVALVVNELPEVVKDTDTDDLFEVPTTGDTAPPSSVEGAGEDSVEANQDIADHGDDEDMEDMPLLNYARLSGSLPRLPKRVPSERPSNPLRSSCTCSVLAQVSLRGEASAVSGGVVGGDGGGGVMNPGGGDDGVYESDADLKAIPQLILVAGFQDGSIQIVEAETGREIVGAQHLKIQEGRNAEQPPIVALSIDSSGTCLAAINEAGHSAVWELRFAATSTNVEGGSGSANTSDTASATTASDNPFASFLNTTFGGGLAPQVPSTQVENQAQQNGTPDPNRRLVQLRLGSIIQTTRLPYSASYGKPTGLALDPAYKRRREKAMLVAFEDGRVVLTKRGLLFQRRNDAVLYQGLPSSSASSSSRISERGMEAIAWRGSVVAWADSAGVKLYDIEHMNRIAHVDRPSGARASLYPTISELRPSLVFETSSNLLLAWGDCVMTMHIRETIVQASTPSSNPDPANLLMAGLGAAPSDSSGGASSQVIKRRTVECSMAWELDCIACGVAPLDADHLVVLGLVPTDESEGEVPEIGSNDIEVQVISRAKGSVTYADVLPLIRLPSNFIPAPNGEMQESANTYALLSSFNLPRMDDAAEVEEEGTMVDQEFDFNIFATSTQKVTFEDYHLRWNVKSVAFEKEEVMMEQDESMASKKLDSSMIEKCTEEGIEEVSVQVRDAQLGTPTIAEVEEEDEEDGDEERIVTEEEADEGSVDSDDYGFIVRHSLKKETSAPNFALPPYMIVVSASDIVTVRLRDIDDAIEFALKSGKVGLAMQRGLRYKRELRRHDLNDIVDKYLKRVLRIDDDGEHLSIRRLQLAAEATPILLGGNVLLWEKWVTEFSQIPGALFILRDFLPVRDPKLPGTVYQTVVNTLLRETTELAESSEQDDQSTSEAKRRFLNALVGWGPMQALRAKIKFLSYHQKKPRSDDELSISSASLQLQDLEKLLRRRLNQSAAGYLQLPTAPVRSTAQVSAETVGTSSVVAHSLFDMVALVQSLSPDNNEIMGVGSEKEGNSAALKEQEEQTPSRKTKIILETLAEVNMMMGNYEQSLRSYLELGVLFPERTLDDLEKAAVRMVNEDDAVSGAVDVSDQFYFVLAMVEFHHLHRCLLDSDFFEYSENGKDSVPPLIAMIQLIGLEQMGHFLVEHCVPPPTDSFATTDSLQSRSSAGTESSLPRNGHETLPINFVADQLTKSPPLLHWYLHLIFLRKPEMYVRFSTTSVPPRAVTDLHRTHLDLYIDYAVDKDSAQSLIGTEEYNLERKTTPLLSFLKAALPLGGIRSDEVRRLLESQRLDTVKSDGADFPHSFAIELAFVIENYGNDSEDDARAVLELYLKGANSVTLATSYVQRNTDHATVLWNELIQYCLENSQLNSTGDVPPKDGAEKVEDGSMFGSLLEAAALVGADLALLVTRIPQGMDVEGLRPRLVAAVGDYRLKLKMHESANEIGNNEKVNLLRNSTHRSRRGTRVTMEQLGAAAEEKLEKAIVRSAGTPSKKISSVAQQKQAQADEFVRRSRLSMRLSERADRYRLSVHLPVR